MRTIRVMVVDDSVVVRRMLTAVLSSDPGVQVVGSAANGRIALARIQALNPDLVVLDVEMPEMDGLTALAEIRKTYKVLPVIMFSTLTERGAAATLDALAFGATDYLTKPTTLGVNSSFEQVGRQLLDKIYLFCAQATRSVKAPCPAPVSHAGTPRRSPLAHKPAEVIAIGISTGGPNALAELMPKFPADLPVPLLIVQHMPAIFTKLLAERLSARAHISVREATDGEILRPGCAWLAPGNFHLRVERLGPNVVTRLSQDPPENWCRPAVDVLFRSAAETYREATLGVIMTGMGKDGLRGCEEIRRFGGQVIAQDESTSVVWGMPAFVVEAGLADNIAPLGEIDSQVMRRVKQASQVKRSH